MDLRKLSQNQLDALIVKAQARRASLKQDQLSDLRKKVKALIAGSGYTAADVLGDGGAKRGRPAKKAVNGSAPGRKRGRKAAKKGTAKKAAAGTARRTFKVKPKYRNPADPKTTWAGRGMQPRWFRDAIAAGKKEKDLLI